MARPTDDSEVFLNQLITQIQLHLQTVGGIYITIGTMMPSPLPLPGFKTWTGYTIPSGGGGGPEVPMQTPPEPQYDNSIVLVNVELETDPVVNKEWNETRLETEGSTSAGLGGNGFNSTATDLVKVKSTEVKQESNTPANTGPSTFPAGTEPSLTKIDFGATWDVIAAQYIARKESFRDTARNDQGDPRLGYGTSMLLIKADPWTTRDVEYGDTTTKENAMLVLQYQVRNTFYYKVVGNGKNKQGRVYQMPKETFDALTKTQKAALVSFAYNCGSFYYYPDIIDNIKAGKFEEAAVGIENGPSKGAEDGKVYTGLIRRRREEAALFRYK